MLRYNSPCVRQWGTTRGTSEKPQYDQGPDVLRRDHGSVEYREKDVGEDEKVAATEQLAARRP
jgi:hypothetical protein